MNWKFERIRVLQNTIEFLESVMEDADTRQEERDRIHRQIGDFQSEIDCLSEACE